MLTKEEIIAIVCSCLRRLMYEQVQEDFTSKFRKSIQTRTDTENLISKLKQNLSIKDEDHLDQSYSTCGPGTFYVRLETQYP